MKIDTSMLMMIAFVILLIISIWKIYAFLPNKQLEDDDKTLESQEELMNIVLKNIRDNQTVPTIDELLIKIENDKDFNKEHYWRFNKNRLNQLLNHYYLTNPHAMNIEDIYNEGRK